jgi:hypothetical protein
MRRKKGKTVSFDAMVKFFMQQYNLPTKKDIDKVVDRLERLERAIKSLGAAKINRRAGATGRKGGGTGDNATDVVFALIAKSKEGIGVPEIKKKTKFDDKKLRNIIFRLHKTGKIVRKRRGLYISA